MEKLKVSGVQTHPALQPRDLQLLKQRERLRQEEQSAMHVHDMALLLQADGKSELAPVDVADVCGVLYVVDGHHRLAAYRRAKREMIPARVQAMTLRQASHASKLANVAGTKLEMRPAQKRNALWHHLEAITHRGAFALPKGETQRGLGGRFGATHDTVQRMLARLPEVNQTAFPPEHCDAITGWPHWRYVCETARNGMYQAMTTDSRTQWQAQKYLSKLLKLWEQTDPEALEVAHKMLRREAATADEVVLRADLVKAYKVTADDPRRGDHDAEF